MTTMITAAHVHSTQDVLPRNMKPRISFLRDDGQLHVEPIAVNAQRLFRPGYAGVGRERGR
jgi:hypothetical protein